MTRSPACLLFGCLLLLSTHSQGHARAGGGLTVDEDNLDTVIRELAKTIANSQVTKSTAFDPPFTFAKQFGIYPSYIMANNFGSPEETLLRHLLAIFDSNAFITLWVTSMLLEVARVPSAPQPDNQHLYNTLEVLSTYHDHNRAPEEAIFVFWPQVYNKTTQFWSCGPENMEYLVKDSLIVLNALHKILDDLGLEKLWDRVKSLYDQLTIAVSAFNIPADFDDTFVNIGLGALLHFYNSSNSTSSSLSSSFSLSSSSSSPLNTASSIYTVWFENNTKFIEAMRAVKKYAYRPLSGDIDSNLIDPRTYFYMREYTYSKISNGTTAAFVTTWVQSLSEDRVDFHKNYSMPFNTNNIDLTVSTNVIYGITSAIVANMSNPGSWFDADLQTVYENTTDLVAWMICHNFSSRPDLALTYYPSVYNFYWFTSRTLNLLSSSSPSLFSRYPVLARVERLLSDALRLYATDTLLESATTEGGVAYWDDFLGDNDTNILGKRVRHGEDRICTTAMAFNALLYSWTVDGRFISNTPPAVMDVLSRAGQWLAQNVFSGKFEPFCVTFSGSVKSYIDLPFFYPYNYAYYLNGTLIPPSPSTDQLTPDSVVGVRGVIPPIEYAAMLKEKFVGENVPMDFHGYNSEPSVNLVFWSSAPFTHAASLLALTRYQDLLASGQLDS